MAVRVILGGSLRKRCQAASEMGELSLENVEGKTVAEVLELLAIPADLVAIVVVNGKQEDKGRALKDGDTLKLLPLFGGGSLGPKPCGTPWPTAQN